jgi:membrane associated rhomboid family serine protease
MGIGDRAYMRDRSAARERLSMTAWVVGILVGFYILTIILTMPGKAGWLDWMVLSKEDLSPWKWVTYALPHGDFPSKVNLMAGFWHLLGNCLIIWWTGSIVEVEYGPKAFWWTIIGGTLSGALFWFLTGLGSAADSYVVGASAAGYSLLMVALLSKLEHQVTLLLFFFLPVTIKVRWLLILLTLFSICGWAFSELPSRHTWSMWHDLFDSRIAHSAHLGGLIFGWLAFRRLNQTNLHVQDAQVDMGSNSSDDSSVIAHEAYAAEESSDRRSNEAKTPSSLTQTQARAELDRLLDKISAGGFGSLTAGEKRRLEELSARLR